ncbi:hypothetical protein [Bradyrhizobium archetypum]|uniref:Uncharacterized protein n=1 Tax=Bradyrhizobium archetypum TaxID=2721160 RepID=A0A7Y4H512_9BRAD|nr:hypothetical protein [Bradyrhizobium archetypum]NOJ47796.1 hypothetical protein [Bradyrhizobium archetypum]
MGQKVRIAKAKAILRSQTLSKQFAEPQKLKEQIRLAEAAAKQSARRRPRLTA